MKVIEDFESRPHKAVASKNCRRRYQDTVEEGYQEDARKRKVGRKKKNAKKVKKKKTRGCQIVVRRRGKNGQSIGNATRKYRVRKTSHGRSEELEKYEEALPRLKEGDFEKVFRLYKAKTRVGCDKHLQCDTKVRDQKNNPWRNE